MNKAFSRTLQRRLTWVAAAVFLVALPVILSGCAWTVRPPSTVTEPAAVYLTEYGKHTRLALPSEEGDTAIEYGFGDWQYYALAERGMGSGIRALFWPSDSAFSRREFEWPDDTQELLRQVNAARSVRLEVEAEHVASLRQALEAEWRRLGRDDQVMHPRPRLYFRRSEENYHLFRSSNQKTAAWLEELGCEVGGWPLLSNFEIATGAQAQEERTSLP